MKRTSCTGTQLEPEEGKCRVTRKDHEGYDRLVSVTE